MRQHVWLVDRVMSAITSSEDILADNELDLALALADYFTLLLTSLETGQNF